jgi:hypothetical protein
MCQVVCQVFTLCARAGLAGLYFVKNSTDVGVGPDRWGLDGMEEYHLMLADRVVDRQCQLRYEPQVCLRVPPFGTWLHHPLPGQSSQAASICRCNLQFSFCCP